MIHHKILSGYGLRLCNGFKGISWENGMQSDLIPLQAPSLNRVQGFDKTKAYCYKCITLLLLD